MNGMRLWTLATVVIIAAILGLGWLIGLSPLLAQAAAANQERTMVEATNAAQSATLAQMKVQFEDIDELRDELEELRTSISSTVDADAVYDLLAEYQVASGAAPALITLGEAVQYGVPAPGPDTTAADAPPSGTAPSSALANTLYQVSVNVSFSGASLDSVLAFVAAMQHGPRLFLVTNVTSTNANASITAYLFVIHDGSTASIVEVPEDASPTPDATPTPTGTAAPDPSGSSTPTPTTTP